jgi:hypothetical protein
MDWVVGDNGRRLFSRIREPTGRFRLTGGRQRSKVECMSTATKVLLAAFETLPEKEKQQFLDEVCRRVGPSDAGPLDDELVAKAGDDLADLLAQEEHDSQAR